MSDTKRRIYCVGSVNHCNWMEGEPVARMEDANLVSLPGGSDWNPEFYHEPRHSSAHFYQACDDREMDSIKKAIRLGLPIVGTCRGAQGLCIAVGGILVQDQRSPG